MKRAATCIGLCLALAAGLTGAAWALERQSSADYRARREHLAAATKEGIIVLFAPLEPDGPRDLFGFRQEDNFFYLSGWPEPAAALLIVSAAAAKDQSSARAYSEVMYLPARNMRQEKWTGAKLGPENPDADRLTGFTRVEPLDKLREDLAALLAQRPSTVYSDLPGYGESSASAAGLEWLKRGNTFPRPVFEDLKPLLKSMRTVKDEGEIALVRKATDASVAAHLAAMHAMKPAAKEREISALLQYEWGRRGCERDSYAPIVGSGLNSTVLHYMEDSNTIQDGDLVVIDAAGEYSMYASDITRTLPANGKFTARQREIYDIVLGAQQAAAAAFQSGKSKLFGKDDPDSINKVAYDYINTHGKDLHGEPLGKYFIHGLGHYVGLGVHDYGDYGVPLGPGMVFTLEPGIYIPEEKLGVRIEDTVYIDKNGKLVNLTAALPHTADEVEREMAKKH